MSAFIPIQNIYYLLCYVWDKLEEGERVAVAAEDSTELVDLFAKVLIRACTPLLKRGIDRAYLQKSQELGAIKGKLLLSESLKRNLLEKQRAICQYDEFSPDVLTNRILVATLQNLLQVPTLDKGLRRSIHHLLLKFPPLTPLQIRAKDFDLVHLHRNNCLYEFPLRVCRIIHDNLLPRETPGEFEFVDFRRDDVKMRMLFERFLFQFYKREQDQFRVRREHIQWKMHPLDQESIPYLPRMETDITLESEQQKIIIDAKFYRKTLQRNFDTSKLRSNNLYQLFAYLLNQENPEDARSMRVRGILIYPSTEEEFNFRYSYRGHRIEVCTLDLNQHWRGIGGRLRAILAGDQPDR
ncbi:MAG: 5-methylcytosine-specific restriction endonuclease system specificity protein McrC [Bacteroidota bacterium]